MGEKELPFEHQRRSPRQDTKLSVRVRGLLRDGRQLDEPAVVDQYSSHGIRVRIETTLPNGSEVEVQAIADRPGARYRVVWALGDSEQGGWQVGLELVKGIEKPPEEPSSGSNPPQD